MKIGFLKYALPVLGSVLAASTSLHASVLFHHLPEIDPSLAIGSFTLLAGSLAVLRARRKKS
ncbi:MAG: hypothetical protein ABR956_14910 [Terracidiphilus sp.]|jgi:uncharacterized membrane protein